VAEIPSYFEFLKEQGEKTDLYLFSYNRESRVFTIGEAEVALQEFDPYTFNPFALHLDRDGIEVNDIPNHPALLPGFGDIILGPKAHEWAQSHPHELAATFSVLYESYTSFFADTSFIPTEADTSHMGFAAGWREYGGIGLQVLGNCACMGPDPYSGKIKGMFEHGYAEYDLHNADTQAQRASLYAGLGHIARLTSEENLQ
jgi:hypothetical protein